MSVLLVLNCQADFSYGNRRTLARLYGDRFPDLLFTVGASCAIDPDFPTLATDWSPRLKHNLCACCDPSVDPHPSGRHATHPRLARVAEYAASRGFEAVVFAEDDCLLGPSVDRDSILARLERHDALVPHLGLCDRDDRAWVWTRHPTGYPAFDAASSTLDRPRMLRHYAAFSGGFAPPILAMPMFGGFVDMLVFRTELLLRMAPDLIALQDVWHEAAIPSALMNRTARVGPLRGRALWGDDRDLPTESLFAMLHGDDYVHPIKLSRVAESDAVRLYGAKSPAPTDR